MKKVSSCCQSEMIPPMSEEEMEDNFVGSNWRAASCYICKECGKSCEAIEENKNSMIAYELRLGNLVRFPSGAEYIVDVLYKNYAMLDFWQPIILTEEWLSKLGYKETESFVTDYKLFYINDGNFDGNFIVRFYRDDIDVAPFSKIPLRSGDLFQSISIQYVHQLQNLYFALTGEELTLKN